MSRIGKQNISVPSTVQCVLNEDTRLMTVKGPLGELNSNVHPSVLITIKDGEMTVAVKNPEDKFQRSIWGTTRAVMFNLVAGVQKPFSKEMELNGVGYKMEINGGDLVLNIGYSHPVRVKIPSNIKLTVNKNVLSGESIDKHALGDFFMKVHNMKPCDVYKQKGFKLPNKFYRKKVGKRGK